MLLLTRLRRSDWDSRNGCHKGDECDRKPHDEADIIVSSLEWRYDFWMEAYSSRCCVIAGYRGLLYLVARSLAVHFCLRFIMLRFNLDLPFTPFSSTRHHCGRGSIGSRHAIGSLLFDTIPKKPSPDPGNGENA